MMAVDEGRGSLKQVITKYVGLDDLLRADFMMAVLGAAAGVYMGVEQPQAALRVAPVAAGVVGVIIGAVIAAIGLVIAFFDEALLRKLDLIQESPQRPLAPLLFSVVLGVAAAFGIALVVGLGPNVTPWLRAPAGLIGFGAAAWTVASLIPALDVLVQFVGVQREASLIDEDTVQALLRERERRKSDEDGPQTG